MKSVFLGNSHYLLRPFSFKVHLNAYFFHIVTTMPQKKNIQFGQFLAYFLVKIVFTELKNELSQICPHKTFKGYQS